MNARQSENNNLLWSDSIEKFLEISIWPVFQYKHNLDQQSEEVGVCKQSGHSHALGHASPIVSLSTLSSPQAKSKKVCCVGVGWLWAWLVITSNP